ncbi:MAG: calcium/sodium antiporter [Bacteroidales bacterium]|nr:calcium/sodium antiporter [Bacteroidales bacterium]
MLLTTLLFISGFVLLIKGSDIMIAGASAVARRYHVSDLVIGLTIVAFGTSSPELAVNLLAGLSGNTDVAIGNALGSNLFNIGIILGVSALFYPVAIQKNTAWKEIPFALLAAAALFLMVNDETGTAGLSRNDGLLLLLFFVIFLIYVFEVALANPEPDTKKHQPMKSWKAAAMIAGGLGALVLGGQWIVDGAVTYARAAGLSEAVISLTIVAAGTSLPELATSLAAARRGSSGMVIGNVVGSNVFNIFLVLGLGSVITPLPFNSSWNFDLVVSLLLTFLVFVFVFLRPGRQIDRLEGGVLVAAYGIYVAWMVMQSTAGTI